jgi:hypothetical protein
MPFRCLSDAFQVDWRCIIHRQFSPIIKILISCKNI